MNEWKPSETPIEKPIEIDFSALGPDALNGIIDSFILREGTDYGPVEFSHEKKVEQVRRQIEKGEVKIYFDSTTETVGLVSSKSKFHQINGFDSKH
jgi:uncharacterized protein YheU (UPF0270 family)